MAVFPAASYPPIIYPFAVTSEAKQAEGAARFLTYLQSPQARPAFEAQGFTLLGSPRTTN